MDWDLTIRALAYQKWEEAGRPDGSADKFWIAAQIEVITASLSRPAPVTIITEVKPKKARAASTSKKRQAA
jgi:hypothetical protein